MIFAPHVDQYSRHICLMFIEHTPKSVWVGWGGGGAGWGVGRGVINTDQRLVGIPEFSVDVLSMSFIQHIQHEFNLSIQHKCLGMG